MKTLLCILLLLVAVNVEGTTYYVRVGGSDGAAGTSWGTAWETMTNVNTTPSDGDSVFINGVHYSAQLLPITGVTYVGGNGSDNTVTHGGGTLVGSEAVTGWANISGNVYRAPWTPNDGVVISDGVLYTLYQVESGAPDTAWIYRETSYGAVDAPGEYFQNAAHDSIYVYVNNMNSQGLDPDDYIIYASNRIVVAFGQAGRDQKHVVIEGLHVFGARAKCVYGGGDAHHMDSCTIRAVYAAWVSTQPSQNGGCFGTGQISDSSNYGHHNRYVHDTANHVNYQCGVGHSNGFIFYSENYCLIESCVVFSDVLVGYHYKGHYGSSQDDVETGDVIRDCIVYGDSSNTDWGTLQAANHYKDSIYGCIFIGCTDGGIMNAHNDNYGLGDGTYIGNNTFVDCGYGTVDGTDGYIGGRVDINYNVFYEMNTNNIRIYCQAGCDGGDDEANDTLVFPDSNMFYSAGAQTWYNNGVGTFNSLAAWQAAPYYYDLHSNTNNPNFDSVGATDPWLGLARSGTPSEMNVTYGGRTWTLFGAVQLTNYGGTVISGATSRTGKTEISNE